VGLTVGDHPRVGLVGQVHKPCQKRLPVLHPAPREEVDDPKSGRSQKLTIPKPNTIPKVEDANVGDSKVEDPNIDDRISPSNKFEYSGSPISEA